MQPMKPDSPVFETFKKACKVRGLSPEGFDVRSETGGVNPLDVLVVLAGQEYRYSSTDKSWAERFFMDIGDDGDSGDGVKFMTSEEEREKASR